MKKHAHAMSLLVLLGFTIFACGRSDRLTGSDPASDRDLGRRAGAHGGSSWSASLLPNEDLPTQDPDSDPWHTWPFEEPQHWALIDEVPSWGEHYDGQFTHASISPPHGVYGKQIDRFGLTNVGQVGNIVVDRIRVDAKMFVNLRGTLPPLTMTLRYYVAGSLKGSAQYEFYGTYADTMTTTWTAEMGAPGLTASDVNNLEVEVEALNSYPAEIRLHWMHVQFRSYLKQKPPPDPTE